MIKDAIVRFDTALTSHITGWPSWLQLPMLVITTLGQPVAMGFAAGIVILYCLLQDNIRPAFAMSLAVIAMALNSLLKHFIHRTRPDTLYVSNMYFQTSSFPSGHTFGATVICGLLACMALKYLPDTWGLAAATALGLFIFLVGVSRIYLGAHYPTDVIAGWVLGGIVVTLIMVVIKP